jgi:hypothetical protein
MVSKFANWALSAKFAKYMPLENNPLYNPLKSKVALQKTKVTPGVTIQRHM